MRHFSSRHHASDGTNFICQLPRRKNGLNRTSCTSATTLPLQLEGNLNGILSRTMKLFLHQYKPQKSCLDRTISSVVRILSVDSRNNEPSNSQKGCNRPKLLAADVASRSVRRIS